MNNSRERLEQETTITFNEAEDVAKVWTISNSVIKRLESCGYNGKYLGGGGAWFTVPKKKILSCFRKERVKV